MRVHFVTLTARSMHVSNYTSGEIVYLENQSKLAEQLTKCEREIDNYGLEKELTAASNPLRFGVKAEYETPGIFFIPSITCLWSAIFGMDRKQTIKQE